MKTRRLAAFAAAASLSAVMFVAAASPASAWDLERCLDTWKKGQEHPDCDEFEEHRPTTTKKPTTTVKSEEVTTTTMDHEGMTTTTVKDDEVTTTAPKTSTTVKAGAVKPAAVKAQPKYTG
jgi:hypothetical protein